MAWGLVPASRRTRTTSSKPTCQAVIKGVAPKALVASTFARWSANNRAISARSPCGPRALQIRLKAVHFVGVPPRVLWFTNLVGITSNKPRTTASMPRLCWDSDAAWWSRVHLLESTEQGAETLTFCELQRRALQVGYILQSICFCDHDLIWARGWV